MSAKREELSPCCTSPTSFYSQNHFKKRFVTPRSSPRRKRKRVKEDIIVSVFIVLCPLNLIKLTEKFVKKFTNAKMWRMPGLHVIYPQRRKKWKRCLRGLTSGSACSTLCLFQRDPAAYPACSDWAHLSPFTQGSSEERRVMMAILLLFLTVRTIMRSFFQSTARALYSTNSLFRDALQNLPITYVGS